MPGQFQLPSAGAAQDGDRIGRDGGRADGSEIADALRKMFAADAFFGHAGVEVDAHARRRFSAQHVHRHQGRGIREIACVGGNLQEFGHPGLPAGGDGGFVGRVF